MIGWWLPLAIPATAASARAAVSNNSRVALGLLREREDLRTGRFLFLVLLAMCFWFLRRFLPMGLD
jgi:hypothetical protein